MPQRELLRYLLLQPYSREVVQNVLSVSKGVRMMHVGYSKYV